MPRASTARSTHWLTWRHARIKLIAINLDHGYTRLSADVIATRDTPVPGMGTGRWSDWIPTADIANAGGPVAYLENHLTAKAASAAYCKAEFLWRQGGLFHHDTSKARDA